MLRFIFFVPLLASNFLFVWYNGNFVSYAYLTGQGLFLATITHILLIFTSGIGHQAWKGLQEVTIILFSISWVMQFLITFVYWGFLHEVFLTSPLMKPGPIFYAHICSIHATPLISLTLNFFLSSKICFRQNSSIIRL
jgi:hypothetical protein